MFIKHRRDGDQSKKQIDFEAVFAVVFWVGVFVAILNWLIS